VAVDASNFQMAADLDGKDIATVAGGIPEQTPGGDGDQACIFPTASRHSFFLVALWVEGMSEECEQSRCSGRAAEDGSQVRP